MVIIVEKENVRLVLNENIIQTIQHNLLHWYDNNARDLPWRKTKDPYKIWVSEIMLQQTKVEAVKGYYMRFLEKLPTVEHLANVSEDELYKLWQGLGYYRRAKHMQQAAQMIIRDFNNNFPNTKEKLLRLKGVGDYSASAIASIAFHEQAAVVDGNVLRVYARLFELYGDITKTTTKQNIASIAKNLLPSNRVGDFNQAVMELGATVCLPNGAPLCNKCPLQSLCLAYKKNLQQNLPVRAEKKQRSIEQKTVYVIINNNKYLLHKRDSSGLLANLWEFMNTGGFLSEEQSKEFLNNLGLQVVSIEKTKNTKHIFTHKEWHMQGYVVVVSNLPTLTNSVFVSKKELEQSYPIPNAFAYFKTLL